MLYAHISWMSQATHEVCLNDYTVAKSEMHQKGELMNGALSNIIQDYDYKSVRSVKDRIPIPYAWDHFY